MTTVYALNYFFFLACFQIYNINAFNTRRIMVLDKGMVVEFDTPINLLAQKGIFYSMAQEAGIA